jgi:hypothetical protein
MFLNIGKKIARMVGEKKVRYGFLKRVQATEDKTEKNHLRAYNCKIQKC